MRLLDLFLAKLQIIESGISNLFNISVQLDIFFQRYKCNQFRNIHLRRLFL